MYSCIGGEGGDGGNGKPGKSNLDKIPENPGNAQDVYNRGPQVDYDKECYRFCGYHQCGCELCQEFFHHVLDITTDACGGNGGNGGNGADGAAAGSLKLLSTSNASIMVINTRVRSNGGSSGTGGVQAVGLKCNRHFTGYMRYWPSNDCSGGFCRHCVNTQYHEEFGNYGYTNNDKDCPGLHGVNGIPGNNWEP